MSWKHFKHADFACSHCNVNLIDDNFVAKLDTYREYLGFPLIVNSGYRCPIHNDAVSTTGLGGPHTTGRAVDFRLRGEQALFVVEKARQFGFTGVGVAQKGTSRFVHLDDLPNAPNQPRSWIWSY